MREVVDPPAFVCETVFPVAFEEIPQRELRADMAWRLAYSRANGCIRRNPTKGIERLGGLTRGLAVLRRVAFEEIPQRELRVIPHELVDRVLGEIAEMLHSKKSHKGN